MSTIPLWLKVIPVYIAVGGLIYLPVATKQLKVAELTAKAAQIDKSASKRPHEAIVGNATRLLIPRLGIDIPIIEGTYSVKTGWNVSESNVHFANGSARANNAGGKTVLYGHDTTRVLKSTDSLTKGDVIYVYTDSGTIFSYTYSTDQTVTPQDTKVFTDTSTGASRLSLITCSGSLSQTRRIMNFTYRGVSISKR